jgi:hypothetical protein
MAGDGVMPVADALGDGGIAVVDTLGGGAVGVRPAPPVVAVAETVAEEVGVDSPTAVVAVARAAESPSSSSSPHAIRPVPTTSSARTANATGLICLTTPRMVNVPTLVRFHSFRSIRYSTNIVRTSTATGERHGYLSERWQAVDICSAMLHGRIAIPSDVRIGQTGLIASLARAAGVKG